MRFAYRDRVVDDANIRETGRILQQMGETLNDAIYRYCDIMKEVTESAIMNGRTSEAIKAITAYAEKLRDQFDLVGETASRACSGFLSDIDDADKYLY